MTPGCFSPAFWPRVRLWENVHSNPLPDLSWAPNSRPFPDAAISSHSQVPSHSLDHAPDAQDLTFAGVRFCVSRIAWHASHQGRPPLSPRPQSSRSPAHPESGSAFGPRAVFLRLLVETAAQHLWLDGPPSPSTGLGTLERATAQDAQASGLHSAGLGLSLVLGLGLEMGGSLPTRLLYEAVLAVRALGSSMGISKAAVPFPAETTHERPAPPQQLLSSH